MCDIDTIKQQFVEVIQYSQRIQNPKVDKLFDEWYNNKKEFIGLFGGRLIYEYPEVVRFELGEAERNMRVTNFANRIHEFYGNESLADFIDENAKGFFKNEVVFEDGPAREGMKLLKAFKYFEADKEVLDAIQTEASRIIQEDKIEGRLCISVHPLDYLSSSENTFNWRSCHALDGEYRCGNLSYMCDNATMIVYLRDEYNHELPHFPSSVPWNSKKWRVLLHISESRDMLFAGRQYPFATKVGLDFILSNLIPKIKLGKINGPDNFWSPWSNYYIDTAYDEDNDFHHTLFDKHLPVGGELKTLKDLVFKKFGARHFDDLNNSNSYRKPYYSVIRHRGWWGTADDVNAKYMRFTIGSKTLCLHCGDSYVEGPGMMVCPSCDCDKYHISGMTDYIECECCGTTIYIDSAVWVGDEARVCTGCAETETSICDRCGVRHWNTDVCYSRITHNQICKWCEEDITFDDDEEEEDDLPF